MPNEKTTPTGIEIFTVIRKVFNYERWEIDLVGNFTCLKKATAFADEFEKRENTLCSVIRTVEGVGIARRIGKEHPNG